MIGTGGIPAGRLVAIDAGPAAARAGAGGSVSLVPGPLSVGLTVDGVPLGELTPRTRLRVGRTAVLELSGDPGDGAVIDASERGRRPARVVSAGPVRVGDPVLIEAVPVPLEDALDLHPFRPDEVAEVVQAYLVEAQVARLGEVRLIHGRGRGVQRETIRRLLATLPIVVAFEDAPPERGGWGATVVWLRIGSEARPA